MLLPHIESAAILGAESGMLPLIEMNMDFDRHLVNQAAVDFAREHVYTTGYDKGLTYAINDTTRKVINKEVSTWIAKPGHKLDDLARRLAPTFGRDRARTIAITEVTNAYAGGAIQSWREVNRQMGTTVITGKQWRTSNDERVCFPAWTMVETETGPMPIQDIRPGAMVWTRHGLRRVKATSKRAYAGDMVTVRAGGHNVTSTADHPYWTLEQGWLQGRNLTTNYTLQTFGNQSVRVRSIAKFRLGQPDYMPAVRFQIPGFALVPAFVSVPIGAVNFEGNARIRQQEVNTIAPHSGLLLESNSHCLQEQANVTLKHVFARMGAIAGKGTKLPVGISRLAPEFNTASQAGNEDGRAAAFFGTVTGRPSGFMAHEFLAASLASASPAGIPALPTANGVAISHRAVNREVFTANGARLGYSIYPAGIVARSGAKRAPNPIRRVVESLPALLTVGIGSLAGALRFGKLQFVVVGRHIAPLLTRYSQLYHRLFAKSIMVYDLEVDEHPEFYANGLLVHNCPICAPLGGLSIEGTVAVAQSAETQEGKAQVTGLGDVFTHPGGGGRADKFKGQVFYRPPAHPRCILPDNEIVLPGHLLAAAKSFYEGNAVEIRLASGRRLTVTENHPILTPNGFVSAKFVREGNYVVSSTDAQRMAAAINPHDDNQPTRIDEIFNAAGKASDVLWGVVPATAEHLHGDGRKVNGNINVVYTDRLLRGDTQSAFFQPISQHNFSNRDIDSTGLSGFGISKFGLNTNGFTGSGFVSGGNLGGALAVSHARPFDRFGLALIPERNPALGQTAGNGGAAYAVGNSQRIDGFTGQITLDEFGIVNDERVSWTDSDVAFDKALSQGRVFHTTLARQFVERFTGLIAADEVIKVRKFFVSSHVYDLSVSDYELYICNGVIVKNCRCWIVPVVEELPAWPTS